MPRTHRPPHLHGAQVNQAAGIVSVQATCGIEGAFTLMSDRADALGLSIADIAAAVLDHAIRFGE